MAIKDSTFVYIADYSDVGLKEVPTRIGFTYHREVLTTKNLPAVLEELSNSEFTSIDTETTGLEFDSCALISVNFSLSVGTEIHSYVAFYDREYVKLHFSGREDRLPDQATILDLVVRFLKVKYCAMHNRLFDQRVLLYATPCTSSTGTMATLTSDPSPLPYDAYSFANVYDTLDMFWFLDSNVKSGLGLKELGRKYLGIETSHFEEAVGLDILNSSPRSLLDYGALDTYMTLSLFRLLLPIFLKRYQVWFKLIPQFKTALYFMESQHQYIDLERTKELQAQVSAEIEELKEQFYSDYGYVNLGSSVEKSRLLFRLGYVTSKMMKPRPDGEQVMSTAAKELEALSAQGCEPAGMMVRYNKLTKFLGTYIEPVISFLEPLDDGSTRPVRFHFIENRVPTARLGSGKYSIGRKPYLYFLPMNLQAITKPHSSLHGLDFDPETLEIKLYSDPLKGEYCVETGDESKNLRAIFAAPPGYKVVKADFSSEEVVLMANQSHEPVWIKAISSGADIHSETARAVFKIPPDQRVDKNIRKKAKACFSTDSWVFDGHSYVRASSVSSLVDPNHNSQGFRSFVEPADGYEVFLSNGQVLRVSAGHLFRCYDVDVPEWVPVEQCLGRQFGILKEPLPGVPQVVTDVGSGLKSQSYHGDIEVDEDLAYLLGLILGDGNVDWKGTVPSGIRVVSHSSSVDYVNSILARFHRNRTDFTCKRFDTYSILHLNSKSFGRFFVDHCGYTRTKHFPDFIFSSPVSVRLAFIAGLLDSDGTVKGGTIKFVTTSPILRDNFIELCALTGIHTSVTKEPAKLKGRVYGNCYLVTLTQLEELHDIPLRVDYKRERFSKLKCGYTGLGFKGLNPLLLKDKVSAEIGSLHKKLPNYDSDIFAIRSYVNGKTQKVGYRNRFLSEEHLQVYPVDVVDIKPWHGDVWFVETDTQQYLAEGQIVHNCTFGLGFSLPGSYFPLMSMSGMPEQEARELEESYRAGLPTLYTWKNRVYLMAEVQGYVRNSFGHERRLRAYLHSKNRRNRDYGLKTALSHLVQGEAGSIMRIALVKLYKLIYGPDRKYNKAGVFNYASHQEINPDVWFLDSVHDEICLVVRNDLVPEVAQALSKLMASCTPPNSALSLQADPEIGDNLGRTFPVEVVEVDGKLKVFPVSEERPAPKTESTPEESSELTFSSDFQELDSLGGMEF